MNDYIKNIIENVKERERLVRERKKREQQERERLERERLEEEKLRKKQELERRQSEYHLGQQEQRPKDNVFNSDPLGAGNNHGGRFSVSGSSHDPHKHGNTSHDRDTFQKTPIQAPAQDKEQEHKQSVNRQKSAPGPHLDTQQSADASSSSEPSNFQTNTEKQHAQTGSSEVPTYNISGLSVTPQQPVSEKDSQDRHPDVSKDVSRNIPQDHASKDISHGSSLKMHDHEKIDLDSFIRRVPDFPKQGILFYDVTTLLKNPRSFNACIKKFADRYDKMDIDVVLGIESRGFIIGSALAHELGVGFVPARKPGKLPASSVRAEYELEYGKDAIEIHKDAISPGQKVLLVDDLVATGGTVKAASSLIKHLGGNIVELAFIIDLKNLHGDLGQPYFSLLDYEVDE